MVLIELYDRQEPVKNITALSAFAPCEAVILLDGLTDERLAKKRMGTFAKEMGIRTKFHFITTHPFDLANVKSTMEKVIMDYGAENVMIDVMGGSDLLLLAAGACAEKHPQVAIVRQKPGTDRFIWLQGEEKAVPVDRAPLTIRSLMALSGGELLRNARVNGGMEDEAFMALVPKIFHVYRRFRSQWPRFVLYLQRLCAGDMQPDGSYAGKRVVYQGKRRLEANEGILAALMECGALKNVHWSETGVDVTFRSETVQKYLCDVGAWLELYCLRQMKESGLFTEVQMSCVLSWDDDQDRQDVTNEIDLIALHGKGQYFISCKTGVPDSLVLAEIAAMADRFGSDWAVPVLITASNLEKEAPGIYRRGAEMGVMIIDADDLTEEKLNSRLADMIRFRRKHK